MRKVIRLIPALLVNLAVFFLANANVHAAIPTNPNAIKLSVTPLPASSLILYDGSVVTSSLIDQPNSWTSTGTETKYGQYSVGPIATNLQCSNGSGAPTVVGINLGGAITAANPDTGSDNSLAFFQYSPGVGSIYEHKTLQGGGSSDTDIREYSVGWTFVTPLSITDFNAGGIKTYTVHLRDGNEYSVTTTAPVIEARFSCDIGTPNSSAATSGTSTKSPSTGAGEVLLGIFVVSLMGSSFLVYKAIEKHRKTTQLSEK